MNVLRRSSTSSSSSTIYSLHYMFLRLCVYNLQLNCLPLPKCAHAYIQYLLFAQYVWCGLLEFVSHFMCACIGARVPWPGNCAMKYFIASHRIKTISINNWHKKANWTFTHRSISVIGIAVIRNQINSEQSNEVSFVSIKPLNVWLPLNAGLARPAVYVGVWMCHSLYV